MDKIVGIDLGTSTSCLAVVEDGKPQVVPDGKGNRVTPSYIHVMDDGRILVGPQAKVEVISDPYSTIWATKRLIGRRYDDEEVQEAKKSFGFDIIEASDGGVLVKGRDKELSPTEVAAIILKYLTRIGKKRLGWEIRKAVVTVPAYFTDPQRKATREAGTMIGLDIVRLVNEPTAAALAYGYDNDQEQTVAVYDLGGGTFDLSILQIGHGVFEVLATDGDDYLGGEDFDNVLVDSLAEDFKKKFEIDIYNDKMAHQRVKDAAERTKIALSERDEAEINLPAICPDLDRYAGVEAVITREQYEQMTEELVDRTIKIFDGLMGASNMRISDIDNVIMVGGMTRMPLVRQKVTEFYGKDPDVSMNPDEAIALGASIHAAGLSGEKLLKKKKKEPAPPEPMEATMPGISGAEAEDELSMPGTDVGDMTMPGTPEKVVPVPPEDEAGVEPLPPPLEVEDLPMDKSVDMDLPADKSRPPEMAGLDDFFAAPSVNSDTAVGGEETVPYPSEGPAAEVDENEILDADEEPIEMEEAMEEDEAGLTAPPQEAQEEEEVVEEGPDQEMDREHPVSAGPIIREYGIQGRDEPSAEAAAPTPPSPAGNPAAEEKEEEYVEAPVLLDVLSQSVGIAHLGGHFVPLIKRFAKLPARASQVFTTCTDGQERIKVSVLQGEDRYVKGNTPLGEFVLEGIEKNKRGVPEIEVSFDIDQSGLFVISARDKRTGVEKEIRLENMAGSSVPPEEAGEVK